MQNCMLFLTPPSLFIKKYSLSGLHNKKTMQLSSQEQYNETYNYKHHHRNPRFRLNVF